MKHLNQKNCSNEHKTQKNNDGSREFRELSKTTHYILVDLEGEQISEIDLKIESFKFGYATNFRINEKSENIKLIYYDYIYRMIKIKKYN